MTTVFNQASKRMQFVVYHLGRDTGWFDTVQEAQLFLSEREEPITPSEWSIKAVCDVDSAVVEDYIVLQEAWDGLKQARAIIEKVHKSLKDSGGSYRFQECEECGELLKESVRSIRRAMLTMPSYK